MKRLSGEDTNFVGIAELADILAQDDEVSACYSRQWLRFGFGETEGLQTDCYAKSLHQDLQNQGHRLKSVVAGLTRTTHFFSRTGSLNERDAPAVELMPDARGAHPPQTDPSEPPRSHRSSLRHATNNGKQCRHKRSRADNQHQMIAGIWILQICHLSNTSSETIDGWSVELDVEGTLNGAGTSRRHLRGWSLLATWSGPFTCTRSG